MKHLALISIGMAILFAGLVFLNAPGPAPQAQEMAGDMDMAVLKPDDQRLVAIGARVYQEACASCHGVDLEGENNWREPLPGGGFRAPPHDETGHTWHHPDNVLFLITKMGRPAFMAAYLDQPDFQSDMPGFADSLSDGEIIAVLSYIKSTWPPHVTVQHDLVNRGGSHH